MSKDWYQDIVNFHEQVINDREDEGMAFPHLPSIEIRQLRQSLIEEETSEALDALGYGNDITEIADGIVDSIVVLIGTAVACGIDIRPIWDEIHRTNMLKKGGKKRADGKQLKPDGWKPPDLYPILEAQGWKHD